MTQAAPLSYCADQVRQGDPDRFLTALFAPADLREHLFALYTFNLEVARIRDQISEPLVGHMRLQWWRDRIGEIYGDTLPAGAETAHALAGAIHAHDLPREAFDGMLEAREDDLDPTPPPTLSALEAYVDATSGVLSVLAVRILGATDTASETAARAVGIAWGLIGQLRVLAHGARARITLPADLMQEAGLTAHDVAAGKTDGKLAPAASLIAATAVKHLRVARRHRHDVARAALPALLLAPLIDQHLNRLDRLGHDPLRGSLEVAKPLKQFRLLWFALRGRY